MSDLFKNLIAGAGTLFDLYPEQDKSELCPDELFSQNGFEALSRDWEMLTSDSKRALKGLLVKE